MGPESLLAVLAPSGAPLVLAPSGRRYFFVQYARCRALRRAGESATKYAPMPVKLLTAGVASPALAQKVIMDELLPVLTDGAAPLSPHEAVLLMRYVQGLAHDPLCRTKLPQQMDELHRAMGGCLSRAILAYPTGASLAPQSAPYMPMQGAVA